MRKFTPEEMKRCTEAYDKGFESSKQGGDKSDNPYDRFSIEASCWRDGFSDCNTLKKRCYFKES